MEVNGEEETALVIDKLGLPGRLSEPHPADAPATAPGFSPVTPGHFQTPAAAPAPPTRQKAIWVLIYRSLCYLLSGQETNAQAAQS